MMKKLTLTVVVALSLALAAPALAQEPLPDLTIEKTGPAEVKPGSLLAYAIEIHNVGDAPAVFPEGSTYYQDVLEYRGGQGHQPGSGGACLVDRETVVNPGRRPLPSDHPLTEVIDCYTSSSFVLGPGESLDHQLTSGDNGPGTVLVQLLTPGRIENCVTVDPYDIVAESDETNNVSCVTTIVSNKAE